MLTKLHNYTHVSISYKLADAVKNSIKYLTYGQLGDFINSKVWPSIYKDRIIERIKQIIEKELLFKTEYKDVN